MQSLVVASKYCDVLKWEVSRGKRIDITTPAWIEAFADTRAVSGFVAGLYPRIYQLKQELGEVINAWSTEFERLCVTLNEIETLEFPMENLISYVNQGENLLARVEYFVQSRVNEVLNTLETLPITELASVARNMIQLSSIEQKLSLKLETVGEPIDVALVSKGDGFNWVNRKPQFE